MVAKILSLLKSLKKTYLSRLIKCVSPLLMGAVLAIGVMQPLTAYAYDGVEYLSNIKQSVYYKRNCAYLTQYSDVESIMYLNRPNYAGQSLRLDLTNFVVRLPSHLTREYTATTVNAAGEYVTYNRVQYVDIDYGFVKLHVILNGKDYVIDLNGYDYTDNTYDSEWATQYINFRFSQDNSRNITLYTDMSNSGITSVLYYIEFCTTRNVNIYRDNYHIPGATEEDKYYEAAGMTMVTSGGLQYTFGESGISSTDYDNATIDSIERNTEQLQEYHELDKSDAEQAGADMTGFASQLDNLKNTWAILWYPIEFTNRFVEVFTGGTQAAAYQDEYTYVTGYRYNDDTGFLEPIQSMAAQPQSAGTGITFPSFELMGYTVWDSYTYDLSQVKEQLPEVFDAIYVFVSILEMLWFVGFLRSKYNEVFG